MRRFYAVKQLADVEIDPDKSHQHEFNAGLLRKALSISEDRVRGSLEFLFFESDDQPPVVDECAYTLYNAREGKPRAAEFRLYYTSALIEKHARTGDLLVITRGASACDLQAYVLRRGTQRERELRTALEIDEATALARFVAVEAHGQVKESTATSLLGVPETSGVANRHEIVLRAARDGAVPRPRALASAAEEFVAGIRDPDDFIDRALAIETELFMAAERAVHTPRMQALIKRKGVTLDDVLGFSMRLHQSRKARRGASLQLHFGALLTREKIPHSPQCKTERGETPDFVIPSCAAYHDLQFGEEHLRMVAFKSRVRERWGQILKEAARIPEKYLLTLDDALTDDTIAKMSDARMRIFLPRTLIGAAYARSTLRTQLSTVYDLVGELRRAAM